MNILCADGARGTSDQKRHGHCVPDVVPAGEIHTYIYAYIHIYIHTYIHYVHNPAPPRQALVVSDVLNVSDARPVLLDMYTPTDVHAYIHV